MASWRSQMKRAGSKAGSRCQRYGSGDQDLYQNVTDPDHCFLDNRIRFCTKISDRVLDWKLYRYRTRCGIFFTTEGTLTYHNRRITILTNKHYWYRLLLITASVSLPLKTEGCKIKKLCNDQLTVLWESRPPPPPLPFVLVRMQREGWRHRFSMKEKLIGYNILVRVHILTKYTHNQNMWKRDTVSAIAESNTTVNRYV